MQLHRRPLRPPPPRARLRRRRRGRGRAAGAARGPAPRGRRRQRAHGGGLAGRSADKHLQPNEQRPLARRGPQLHAPPLHLGPPPAAGRRLLACTARSRSGIGPRSRLGSRSEGVDQHLLGRRHRLLARRAAAATGEQVCGRRGVTRVTQQHQVPRRLQPQPRAPRRTVQRREQHAQPLRPPRPQRAAGRDGRGREARGRRERARDDGGCRERAGCRLEGA